MIYSRANLLVSKVASRDGLDKGLHGVRLEADGATVASNGQIMMIVSPVDPERASFPPEAGDLIEPGGDGMVIPVDAIDKVIKNISRDKKLSVQYVGMTKAKDKARVGFTTIDEKNNPTTYACIPKRDKYPPWRKVVRGIRGDIKICVNRKDMLELLNALEAACPDKGGINPVFIEINPDGRGMLFRCVNYDTRQHAIGIIGNYDTKGIWLAFNEWEKRLFRVIKKAITRRLK